MGPERTSELVLIVEDDEATREAFALILSAEGYRVQTAVNGQHALEQLRSGERPGLILLDLMMPVMDGFQLREKLRQDDRLCDIPVIVCSAYGVGRDRGGKMDVAAYLDKPVEVPVLLEAVRRHC
jgi:CheY-like chemotaxis protein